MSRQQKKKHNNNNNNMRVLIVVNTFLSLNLNILIVAIDWNDDSITICNHYNVIKQLRIVDGHLYPTHGETC